MADYVPLTNLRGPAARITEVTAEEVPAGSDLTPILSGPDQNRKIDLKIPKGERGLDGVNGVANDTATAGQVANTTSQTRAELKKQLDADLPGKTNMVATDVINNGPLARASAVQQAMISKRLVANKGIPNRQILINGATTDPWLRVSTTVSDDVPHAVSGGKAWKISTAAAVSGARAYIQPAAPVAIHPSQSLFADLWIDDPTLITSITVSIRQATGAVLFTRSNISAPTQPLVAGRNRLRWKMAEGLPVAWDGSTLDQINFYMTTTAAASVSIGEIGLEWHAKAKMIFVLDRGYESFVNGGGVADLDALGIPITWAIDVQKIGDRPANPIFNAVTLDYLRSRASKGDSISFHGYTAAVTATMTPSELVQDTILSQAWARQNGFVGAVLWRAAMVQDTALPASAAAAGAYLVAQAQYSMPSFRLDSWPPRDMKNIARTPGMDGQTTLYMDALKRTRGLMVMYQHGIQEGYPNDATPAEWAAWRDALAAALTEGWLEATTFEDLYIDSQAAFA
jgi:hypothetical protein